MTTTDSSRPVEVVTADIITKLSELGLILPESAEGLRASILSGAMTEAKWRTELEKAMPNAKGPANGSAA